MNAKEYLSQAWYLDKRIKTKERQLQSMRAHIAFTSPTISDIPRNTASRHSLVEDTVVKIVDLENTIRAQIEELLELRHRIADIISAVNHPEYITVLEMRYLSFLTWEEISTELGFSLRYTYKLHNRALEMVSL